MVFLLLLSGLAAATAIPTLQGRGLVLGPCVEDPAAACWEEAAVLRRFAAAPSLVQAPLEAEVRLAWTRRGLLARVDGLPEGAQLELSVSTSDNEQLATAESVRLDVGVGFLRVPKLVVGQERAVRVGLLVKPRGALTMPWTPAGPVDVGRAVPVLFVDELTPRSLEVEVAGEGLRVEADGAALSLEVHGPAPGPLGRGGVGPWRLEGSDALDLAQVPETGWYRLEARWSDHLDVRWLFLEASLVPEAVADGVHPAPPWTKPGRPFVLRRGARIAVREPAWTPSAELLAEELERRLGWRPEVVRGAGSRGDLRLAPVAEAPSLPAEALELAGRPEGFAVQSGPAGAWVVASSVGGATYGSLALADAIGTDGRTGGGSFADAPALPLRAVVHMMVSRQQPFELESARAFLHRIVARGRFNLLVLHVAGSVRYSSLPELNHSRSIDPELLRQLVGEARALGIDVAPGVAAPAHAEWLSKPHPELTEGIDADLLCLRHPDTFDLLGAVYDELLEIFEQPRYVHAGHDEIRWRSQRHPADQRCPRCQGTPRWQLVHESLAWHADFFAERGVRPIVWSDMLVRGWNGAAEGSHRAIGLLTDAQRETLLAMSWAPLGDSVGVLPKQGVSVIRGYTGYLDHKRTPLLDELDQIEGESVGIFVASPLGTLTYPRGDRALNHHWGSVLLAGATAWRPELVRTRVRSSIASLSDTVAYRPGYRHPAAWAGKSSSLEVVGDEDLGALPAFAWPEHIETPEVVFGALGARVAHGDRPVRIEVGAEVAGLSLLQSSVLEWEAEHLLRKTLIKRGAAGGSPIAELLVTYTDGETHRASLRMGLDTDVPGGDLRRSVLWGAAAVARLPSVDARSLGAAEGELRLYRTDWINPRPEAEVSRLEVRALVEGAHVIVAAAEALLLR